MPQTLSDKPLKAVSAVIIKNTKVLLVKRSQPPLNGTWNLPGGKVKDGESEIEAIKREILEESGLSITRAQPLGEHILRDVSNGQDPQYHFEIKVFKAETTAGDVKAGSDAREAKFVPLSELDNYNLPSETVYFIENAQSHTLTKQCHPSAKHSVKGHLKIALIALVFGLAAYAILFGLMKVLKTIGLQDF